MLSEKLVSFGKFLKNEGLEDIRGELMPPASAILDCLFIICLVLIGLQIVEKNQEPENFKEFECPEMTYCGVGQHEFR